MKAVRYMEEGCKRRAVDRVGNEMVGMGSVSSWVPREITWVRI